MREEDSLPVLLLLTCCVDPKGMAYTVINDRETRIKQYYEAFDYYLENTLFKILIVENTLFDIDEKYLTNDRVEYLTFDGNNFDKSLGKGYGEALILEHALKRSQFLNNSNKPIIIKITGRLKVLNINELLNNRKYLKTRNCVSANITWDLSFAYSYFFISTYNLFKDIILNKELINDEKGYYFEHLLLESIKKEKKESNNFIGLNSPILIEGKSGSTGQVYKNSKSFLDIISLKIKNKYIKCFLK